jgi:hypothetical protein
MLRSIFRLLVFSAAALSCFSQAGSKWSRIDLGELKFSFPSPLVVDAEQRSENQVFRVIGYEQGMLLDFSIRAEKKPFETLKLYRITDSKNERSFEFGKFKIKEFTFDKPDAGFNKTLYIASENYFYRIKINGKDATGSVTKRILESITLGGSSLFPQTIQFGEEVPVIGNRLKTSTEVDQAFNRKIPKSKDKSPRFPFDKKLSGTDFSDYSRPLIILERPAPSLPSTMMIGEQQIHRETDFWVKAKVTFLATGEIGEISVYSNSELGFQAACLEAARKIRFLPAQKDGKNVDSVDIINFQISFAPLGSTTVLRL